MIFYFFLLLVSLVSINSGAITIDGKLNEPEWGKGKTFSDFSFLESSAKSGKRPEAATSFKYFSDRDNVYFGIKCFENKMSKLRAKVHGNDNNPWRDDVVELFLSPECLPANFYQFVVAAGGCKWQMYYEEKGVTKPDFYMPIYQAKVFKGKNFWSVEIKLPLKAFYMTSKKFWKKNWLVNIARDRRHKELTSWSRLNQSFHESDKFGILHGFPAKQEDVCIREASLNTDAPKHGDITVKVLVEKAGKYNLNGKYFTFKNGANKAIIKDVVFPETGKNKYKFTLKKNDKVIAERFYPVEVNYVPLSVEFTSPGYKDCFFPGQKNDCLKGAVKAANKTVIMVDGKKYKCENGKFDIDISGIKKDRFTVELKSGAYRIKRIIRRLLPVKNKFYYIKNNCLIVKGKPIFILSWYGGNWWCCGREFREKYPANNDKHPCNIKGQVTLEPSRLIKGIEAKEATRDIKPSPELFVAVKNRIEKYRNKDFVWYYLCDEPECRGISPVYLKYIYDYIKQLDPYHPVLIVSRAPARYLNACDIMSPHPYILAPISTTVANAA